MRALPRARHAWRPWDAFFAQLEADGQSFFCLMSISLLFYPLTPFGHVHVVQFFPALSRFVRVFVVYGRLLFSISQVLWFSGAWKEERNKSQEHGARRGQGQMLGHDR